MPKNRVLFTKGAACHLILRYHRTNFFGLLGRLAHQFSLTCGLMTSPPIHARSKAPIVVPIWGLMIGGGT